MAVAQQTSTDGVDDREAAGAAGPPTVPAEAPTASATRRLPFVMMLAAVTVAGLLPFLRNRSFYLAGDSIAQWLPVNRRIGELLRNGESHLMDPTLWRGGNFIGEARFGVWNPVTLLVDIVISFIDDLAVSMLLVSLLYLLLLAVGVYFLAREYGAQRWPSAVVGVVAATGGWTLWMDAAWWTPHLASLAYTPFVWIAARRVARGASGPGWLVLAGALCVTAGNPYSNILMVVIVIAVAVEFADRRRPIALAALFAALVSIGLIAIFVYLPFQQTSAVGPRSSENFNDGSWVLGPGDLLTMSTPTARPFVLNFGSNRLGFPGSYLAWFVLPLAPWLRWRTLLQRRFAGTAVVAGVVLLFAVGPSNFWFFRWPMRLMPYVYLPALVALAVVLGAGLIHDRRRLRASLTAAIVVIGGYLAAADVPVDIGWHLVGTILVLTLSAIIVLGARRHPGALGPLLIVTTLLVLAVQLVWKPLNEGVRDYGAPQSAATFIERFADRYDGTVVQIVPLEEPPAGSAADLAYQDLAYASMHAISGVEAVSTYSGIGFSTHDATLCLRFDGAMCDGAWAKLWQAAREDEPVVADLLGANTVVVQRSTADAATSTPPAGWSLAETTATVEVWKRDAAEPWPEGRLTDVSGPVVVESDIEQRAHREVVRFRRTGDGPAQLTFGRLAWPGYVATVDDKALQVGGGTAGLLTVAIPPEVDGGELVLAWMPPYWRPSLLILTMGVLLGIASELAWRRVGRRPR